MSADNIVEKLESAEKLKAEGNTLFRNKDFKGAVAKYAYAYMYVKGLGETAGSISGMGASGDADTMDAELRKRLNTTNTSIQLNQAACYLRLEKYERCVKSCSAVLKVDERNTKALFRRGQAYLRLRDVDRAEIDLKQADNLNPNDKSIRKELTALARERKRQNAKQARAFKGLFDRGDVYDKEPENVEKEEDKGKAEEEAAPQEEHVRAPQSESEPQQKVEDAAADEAEPEPPSKKIAHTPPFEMD